MRTEMRRRGEGETRRRGEGETRRGGDTETISNNIGPYSSASIRLPPFVCLHSSASIRLPPFVCHTAPFLLSQNRLARHYTVRMNIGEAGPDADKGGEYVEHYRNGSRA
jgi:hypothetical protein